MVGFALGCLLQVGGGIQIGGMNRGEHVEIRNAKGASSSSSLAGESGRGAVVCVDVGS